MIKIDAEAHDAVILADLDPMLRPKLIWVEWHRSYQFYDYQNLVLEDLDSCTPESAQLFNISRGLGYQIFKPGFPLRRVKGCENKHYEQDLLLLKTEFVKHYSVEN